MCQAQEPPNQAFRDDPIEANDDETQTPEPQEDKARNPIAEGEKRSQAVEEEPLAVSVFSGWVATVNPLFGLTVGS